MKQRLHIPLIIAIVFISRFWLSLDEGAFFSFDSGSFALAAIDYSIEESRPHLPGYFLYAKLCAIIYSVGFSNQFSVLILAVLFSTIGSVVAYLVFRHFSNSQNAFILTNFLIFNPLFWFYGSIPEIYTFDLVFSFILIWLGINKNYYFILPILALAAGFRQSSPVLLLPLAFWFIYLGYKNNELNIRNLLISFFISIIVFIAWLLPMVYSAGGIQSYLALFEVENPLPESFQLFSLKGIAVNVLLLSIHGIYGILPTVIVMILAGFKKIESNLLYMLLSWIMPSLLFFIFFHYAKAYILLISGGVFLYLALNVNSKKLLLIKVLTIAQIIIYFLIPYEYPNAGVQYKKLRGDAPFYDANLQRMKSYYLVSYSHIKSLNKFYSELNSGINEIESNNGSSRFYIDRSVVIPVRCLQAKHIQTSFISPYSFVGDSYFLYNSLKMTLMQDLKEELKNSVIIAEKNFFREFLSDYSNVILDGEYFVFFESRQNEIQNLYNLYKELSD